MPLFFGLLFFYQTPTFEIVSSDTALFEGVNIACNMSPNGSRFGLVEKYKGIWYEMGKSQPVIGYWGEIQGNDVTIHDFKVYPGQGPGDIPHGSMIWFIQPIDDYFVVGISNGEFGVVQLRYYSKDYGLIKTLYPRFAGDASITVDKLKELREIARNMWDSEADKLKPNYTQTQYSAAWDAVSHASQSGGFIQGSEFSISRDGKCMIGRFNVSQRVLHKSETMDRYFGYYQWIVIDVETAKGFKIIPVVDQSAQTYSRRDVYSLSKREQMDLFERMNQETIAEGLRRNANWFRLTFLGDGTLVQIWPSQAKLKIMDSQTFEVTKTIELQYPDIRVLDAFWAYYGRNANMHTEQIQKAIQERPRIKHYYEARHTYWIGTEKAHRTNGVPRELFPGLTEECPPEIAKVLIESKPYFKDQLEFNATVFGVIATGKTFWVIGLADIPDEAAPTESTVRIQEYSKNWEKIREFTLPNNNPNMLSLDMQLMVHAISPTRMIGLREDLTDGVMVSVFNVTP